MNAGTQKFSKEIMKVYYFGTTPSAHLLSVLQLT